VCGERSLQVVPLFFREQTASKNILSIETNSPSRVSVCGLVRAVSRNAEERIDGNYFPL
jgi:hypothetical protein